MNELEVVATCHAAMDQSWERLAAQNAASDNPVEVVCRSGCAACCTQLPDASTAEGALLAYSIQFATPPTRAEALERMYAWEWEFGQFVVDNPIVMPSDNWREHLLWRARWQLRRVACPFLEDDHTCGVYRDRPSTCRSHHACMPPSDSPEARRPPPEGCFADPVLTATGQLRRQWTLNSRLSDVFSASIRAELEGHGFEFKTFALIPVVLIEGRKRYGWAPPATVPPTRAVRILRHAKLQP